MFRAALSARRATSAAAKLGSFLQQIQQFLSRQAGEDCHNQGIKTKKSLLSQCLPPHSSHNSDSHAKFLAGALCGEQLMTPPFDSPEFHGHAASMTTRPIELYMHQRSPKDACHNPHLLALVLQQWPLLNVQLNIGLHIACVKV